MSKTQEKLSAILDNTIGVILGLFGSAIILAFLVMWSWNYTMPIVFHLERIDYWHAFWLYFLSGLLIKSITITKN